jgi:hypothetical protein
MQLSQTFFTIRAYAKPTSVMIRLFVLTFASIVAILSTSCGCCTSDSKAPRLRPLPKFQEIEAAPTGDPVQIGRTK